MGFKEFLKENALQPKHGYESAQIDVKDFGEWCWGELLDTDEVSDFFDWLVFETNSKINLENVKAFADKEDWVNIYWEFAIACLGEKEVIKRLDELRVGL